MPYWFYNYDEFGGEYDSQGKELLHFPTEFLYPDYEVKDTCEKISEDTVYALKYINTCSGERFCERNEHLKVRMSLKHKYLWIEGTTDRKVWITKPAENYLRTFMKHPHTNLKEAISHCCYCEVITKKADIRKFCILVYNEQESYPIRLSSITIPAKAAVYPTIKLLLSLFSTINIKFDDGDVLELSAKDYNRSITFHSPLVENNTIEIEHRAEDFGIELDNYKIDEYGVCYSIDDKSLLMASSNLQFYIVKETVECIEYSAFANCTNLKLLILPQHLKILGIECFYNCRNLRYIYLPKSILQICKGVFSYCSSLRRLELPTELDYLSFDIQYCDSLQSIKMPLEIKAFNTFEGVGYGCDSLEEIQIPRGQLTLYKKRFPWIKKNAFTHIFKEYVEDGCIPGKDIRYRELALDYCRFWQNDWNNNSYYRCFNYGIHFVGQEKDKFYYRPYRNIREQEIWETIFDDEEMNEIINKELTYNPFIFEKKLIVVSYYKTCCVEDNKI